MSLYIFLMSGQTWLTFPAQGQDKKRFFFFFFCGREPPPAHQTLNKKKKKKPSPPPSSFTIQGRLMLATPPQLACSLWCGLSGGEHTSAAPRSPNEMPVSEGACGTVKVKKKKKKKTLRGCPRTRSWVVEETIEVHTAGPGKAGG